MRSPRAAPAGATFLLPCRRRMGASMILVRVAVGAALLGGCPKAVPRGGGSDGDIGARRVQVEPLAIAQLPDQALVLGTDERGGSMLVPLGTATGEVSVEVFSIDGEGAVRLATAPS